MRSKTFMELEKLEEEFNTVEKERDQYKKALHDKDRECEELRRELTRLKMKIDYEDISAKKGS
eukprot:CAMPEP_0170548166 /NCGR_PEP_ID=MMETSP0211-20121228/6491_1 /TAXON_ID=311385 /ORGANISM="Pseudokeronopsis sp., Strain OXSARD2" /LENGTH=62 /DNA_ID=CAMNT_0010853555 /DNA_START=212 /DNA_END=403 /DNA_ORIENTATION=-